MTKFHKKDRNRATEDSADDEQTTAALSSKKDTFSRVQKKISKSMLEFLIDI